MKVFINRMFEIMVAAGQIPADSLARDIPAEPVNTPPYDIGPFVEPASQVPPYTVSFYLPPASQVPPATVARKMGTMPRWTATGSTTAWPREIGLFKFLFETICYILNAPTSVPLSAMKGITRIAESVRDMAEETQDRDTAIKAKLVELAMRHEMGEIPDEEFNKEVRRLRSELEEEEES